MNETIHTKFGNAKIDNGYYRIKTRKEGNNGKLLHRLIFEDFYKFKIPNNYIIHHKNGNKIDNCILNLQILKKEEHNRLHSTGKNNPQYGKYGEKNPFFNKKHTEDFKIKMHDLKTKKYARIIKCGFNKGRQIYGIKKDGKRIKVSIYPNKLIKWFKINYPNEILVMESS